MIDSVFLIESIREKHRKAPCLTERERYLTYLLQIGTSRKRVRNVASMLLHIVRLLKLDSSRPVTMGEIVQCSKHWVDESEAPRLRASRYTFQVVATNWLRFQGALLAVSKPALPFDNLLSEFLNAMRLRGMALEILRSYRSRVSAFLNWLHPHCPEFSSVRASDIANFLEAKQTGWSRSSIATHCRTLRTFFGYAEQQRWCSNGIGLSISGPPLATYSREPKRPSVGGGPTSNRFHRSLETRRHASQSNDPALFDLWLSFCRSETLDA
jgi:hypothetical protein